MDKRSLVRLLAMGTDIPVMRVVSISGCKLTVS